MKHILKLQASWLFVALSAGSVVAKADISMVATYNPAGTTAARTGALCAGTTNCVVGTENFDSWNGGAFTTDFGTGNQITGSYSGGFHSYSANQYGGAGGAGKYPEIFRADGSYSLSLTTGAGVPGVNYFGLWYSALDGGNMLQFYSGNSLVYSFTPAKFIDLVGGCSSGNQFCGNPNQPYSGQDSHEQFAFLNFFDHSGYFDKVVFSEPTGGGGFESDNHTVAYLNPITDSGVAITPEPSLYGFLGLGCLALYAGRRLQQKQAR